MFARPFTRHFANISEFRNDNTFGNLSGLSQLDGPSTLAESFDGTPNSTLLHGFFVVLIGAFCFGTTHVPIRRFASGDDGLFVQWVMSFGSLMVGFAVNVAMGSPPIRLLATGGGVLWTFANSLAQFVISGLGLAPALLLWSTTNILTGWSAGRFGLFGLKKKVPEHELLNVIGLITILTGGICFAFVKKSLLQSDKQVHVYPSANNSGTIFEEADEEEEMNWQSGKDGEIEGKEDEFDAPIDSKERRKVSIRNLRLAKPFMSYDEKTNKQRKYSLISSKNQRISATQQRQQHRLGVRSAGAIGRRMRKWLMRNSHRLLCISLALISGFFYSVTVIPVIYIQDHPELFPNAPRSGLNYIFSHYFGIFLGSSSIFIVYALIRGNKPTVTATVVLPSLLSGAIWGCGMVCLFLSNDLLTQTVTYPVLVTIPGCVAALWSIYYFKEIRMNRQNSLIIACSFLLIFCGAFMSFISRSNFHHLGIFANSFPKSD